MLFNQAQTILMIGILSRTNVVRERSTNVTTWYGPAVSANYLPEHCKLSKLLLMQDTAVPAPSSVASCK